MTRHHIDETYDGLPPADWIPPSREQVDFDERVLWYHHMLVHMAAYADAGALHYHLSLACCGLADLAARRHRPERITPAKRDDLFRAILEARFTVECRAPDLGADVIAAGFDGLLVLANHLVETDEERAARRRDIIYDAFDSVRIMRNLAHNTCLADEIRERAAKRRSATVADIIASALEVAA